jgi:hypothetical protein
VSSKLCNKVSKVNSRTPAAAVVIEATGPFWNITKRGAVGRENRWRGSEEARTGRKSNRILRITRNHSSESWGGGGHAHLLSLWLTKFLVSYSGTSPKPICYTLLVCVGGWCVGRCGCVHKKMCQLCFLSLKSSTSCCTSQAPSHAPLTHVKRPTNACKQTY